MSLSLAPCEHLEHSLDRISGRTPANSVPKFGAFQRSPVAMSGPANRRDSR